MNEHASPTSHPPPDRTTTVRSVATARRTAIVFTGGGLPDREVPLPSHEWVIAADSGLHGARAIGLTVDLLVGDLDSVDAAAIGDTPVQRHPVAKDATDLELAIDAAIAAGANHVVVVGGTGQRPAGDGRLDHLIGELLLLGARRAASIEGWIGTAWIGVVHGPGLIEVGGRTGELVTIVPLHGRAAAISTTGLRFPLSSEDLGPGTTRGLSNEHLGGPASVSVEAGTLLRRLQAGARLAMPHARAMPSIGSRCHERRIVDAGKTWR